MLRVHDDPAFVTALMTRCEEYALAYGRALAESGADMLSGGDSPAGLLGPRTYETTALPAEQRLIRALKAITDKPVSLHICGNATASLPLMAASGADVLEIDHAVNLETACRLVRPDIALWGNLDPVGTLAQGTPHSVLEAARAALKTVQAADRRRFVLSSGCTLALETPPANLHAFFQADGRECLKSKALGT